MATIITIETIATEPWVETSPTDPTTGTLTAVASTKVTSTDSGPWTVSFPAANTYAAVTNGTRQLTAFTVTLNESGSAFSVTVKE